MVVVTPPHPQGSRNRKDDEEEGLAPTVCHHYPRGHVCVHMCVHASERVLVCVCKSTSASVPATGRW